MPTPERVTVALGERSYGVHIHAGGLEGLGRALAETFSPRRVILVSNPVVAALHLGAAVTSLRGAGFDVAERLVPDGEAHKTLGTWERLVEDLLEAGVDRGTPVVSLGGGVTGDLVGFAAATVVRGVPFVQVPTTLLAMVDASIGGKTGVNTPHGKNLVGAFHQPSLVFAGVKLLHTLPPEEWRCGMGEALKHGVIRDAGLVRWLGEHASELERRDLAATAFLVRRCCEIKAEVVSADERESGLRAILNFGHTVGHAVETALGHGSLRHGEAIALGMLAETRFAVARGWCGDPRLAPDLARLLGDLGLPVDIRRWVDRTTGSSLRNRLEAALRMDKKAVRGTLTLVIPVAMGEVRRVQVPAETIPDLLEWILPWENEA